VVPNGKSASTKCANFLCHNFAILHLATGDNDVCAMFGKCNRHLAPKSAATTSDDGNFAFE
jgi:hypothetical protein